MSLLPRPIAASVPARSSRRAAWSSRAHSNWTSGIQLRFLRARRLSKLVTTGTTPQRAQIWKSAVFVPKEYLETSARSFTANCSLPLGLDVHTPRAWCKTSSCKPEPESRRDQAPKRGRRRCFRNGTYRGSTCGGCPLWWHLTPRRLRLSASATAARPERARALPARATPA